MKKNKRLISNILEIAIGIVLTVCGYAGVIDEYWSGMGSALVIVGVLMLVRQIRYRIDETYKENVDVEVNDERNQYIRIKAWSWAGYFFVMAGAFGSIIFKILHQDSLSVFAGCSVCLIMVLYWISYLILKKKY